MRLLDSNKEEYGEIFLSDDGLIIVPKKDNIWYYQLSFKVSFPKDKDKKEEYKQTLYKSRGIMLNDFEDYIYNNIDLYEKQLRTMINNYEYFAIVKKDLIDYYGIPYRIELLKELDEWDEDTKNYHEFRLRRLEERLKRQSVL